MKLRQDPWLLDGEQLPQWTAHIVQIADADGRLLQREARWEMFALSMALKDFASLPVAYSVKQIIMYGPLAQGQVVARIPILAIMRMGTPSTITAQIWNDLSQIFLESEQEYAVHFDCLLLTEEEMLDPLRSSHQLAILREMYVVVWPAAVAATIPTSSRPTPGQRQ